MLKLSDRRGSRDNDLAGIMRRLQRRKEHRVHTTETDLQPFKLNTDLYSENTHLTMYECKVHTFISPLFHHP